ncbi:AAA family ATPase [Nostoc sp.]|uniref:AAA family ATPase n=1 Tax=Nostoc sp. TaxID=1180 RepID=UPI002FFC22BD
MNIDQAKEKFDQIYVELMDENVPLDTEQDARFQVIDRILVEVLGWDRSGIRTEPHTDSGYVDYLLTAGNRNRLVVEAKRTSRLLIDTHQPRMAWYKVNGPALQSATDGLEQAKRYCTDTAVLFSALTTGLQWIGFWAVRTDGVPPKEGKAAVFPSLEAIQKNFAVFYDLFSQEGVLANLYQVHVHHSEGLQINHSEVLESVIEISERRLLSKSGLLRDLENIYRSFFSSMSGEDDPDMLAKCFVESKESRAADESLEKITRNLLNQIDIVNSDRGTELEDQIRVSVESQRGDFILIIGNKGAGKSTFVDRFFRLVLDKQLRENCLTLRVDLANSDGNQVTIANWLTDKLKIELEKNLFKDGYPTYDELQGVFFQEYRRWSNGEHKYLYEKDKITFKQKFGEWMADIALNQPQKYVRRLIENAAHARRLMPCIVFDNTDHFPQTFQESVFQYAQSIYRECFSFIICPITDRTIWQLSKSGPLQSYEHRGFYLPVPSTKEVIAKRVNFIKEKAKGNAELNGNYFTDKGIRLSIPNITAFAFSVEDIFINEDYISRIVGWLSNFDIRRSLQIVQRVITSPIIDIGELVKAYAIEQRFRPQRINIKKALLFGDYNHFNQQDSSFILNLFEVNPNNITSPLIRLSILRLLMDVYSEHSDSEKKYLTAEDILNYFEPATVSRTIVKDHLKALLDYRLIEPYDPTDIHIYESQRVKITHCGRIHYEFVIDDKEGVYMSEMALMTPVSSQQYIEETRNLINTAKLTFQDWRAITKSFVEYCLQQDKIYISLPQSNSYQSQRILRETLRNTWL